MHVSPMSLSDTYKRRALCSFEHQSIFNSLRGFSPLRSAKQSTYKMKCIAVITLFALVVIAMGKPLETESIEPAKAEVIAPETEAARNKRGLLLGAAYTAPVAYSAAYTAPVAYSSAYNYPVAYSAYAGYPYYASAYTAPYYFA